MDRIQVSAGQGPAECTGLGGIVIRAFSLLKPPLSEAKRRRGNAAGFASLSRRLQACREPDSRPFRPVLVPSRLRPVPSVPSVPSGIRLMPDYLLSNTTWFRAFARNTRCYMGFSAAKRPKRCYPTLPRFTGTGRTDGTGRERDGTERDGAASCTLLLTNKARWASN